MLALFEQLKLRAAEWNVAIDETRETEGSVLGFGLCDGNRVVIKVSKYDDERKSGGVLRVYQGAGTVRVFEFKEGSMLLEQLDPGTELVELVREGRDEEATAILAGVITQMANHEPPPDCPTVFDWARGFDRYHEGAIPLQLVREAEAIYRSLATSQKQTMLLHGDLHHYNVLFDSKRGWVTIDPKGVVGELEYELGAIIRNPGELPQLYLSHEVIERRLRTLTSALQLDYQRALGWSFAQAVLSAIWSLEDGFEVRPDHPTLQLARVIRSMRD